MKIIKIRHLAANARRIENLIDLSRWQCLITFSLTNTMTRKIIAFTIHAALTIDLIRFEMPKLWKDLRLGRPLILFALRCGALEFATVYFF